MSAARKLKNGPESKEMSKDSIGDLYYISINEISLRTTYDRTSINGFIRDGSLRSEKKNRKRVIKVSDFVSWWTNMSAKA